jgi:hypothetical protein
MVNLLLARVACLGVVVASGRHGRVSAMAAGVEDHIWTVAEIVGMLH